MTGSPPPLARIVVAAMAVPLIAWFAVLARDQHVGREAAQRVIEEPSMSDAEWARTMGQLRSAELLNPGSEWTVQRAASLLLRDKPAAERLARSVVRREPDNMGAWHVIRIARRPSGGGPPDR